MKWGILFVGLLMAVFIVSCSERLKAWRPPPAHPTPPNPCKEIGMVWDKAGYRLHVFRCNFKKSTCIVVPESGIRCVTKKEASDA